MPGLVAAVLPLAACGAEKAWERGPFAAKPTDLLAAAKEVEAHPEVNAEFLYHDTRLELLADGSFRSRWHFVRRILDRQADPRWNESWKPTFEERPKMRARVVLPDGKVFELDPKDIAEQAAGSGDANVLTDRRTLLAALPVGPRGTLIEGELVREWRPILPTAGFVRQFSLRQFLPTHQQRLEIVAPKGLAFGHAAKDADVEPRVEERGGRKRVVYETGLVESVWGLESGESDTVGESDDAPIVTVWTGRDWGQVAGAYDEVAQPKCVATDGLARAAREMAKKANSREELLQSAVEEVARLVPVYTSFAFGERSIVPRTPAGTIQRTRGDCKDQSVLLTTLLREAGVDAHLALVNTYTPEIDESAPGLEAFNHVVVYVPGDEPVWIDPTARFARPGNAPAELQGHRALVVGTETTRLVEVPKSRVEDNLLKIEWETRPRPWGASDATVRIEATGEFERPRRRYRSQFDLDTKAGREQFRQAERNQWVADEVVEVESVRAGDFSNPFRRVLRVTAGERLGVAANGGVDAYLEQGTCFENYSWVVDQAYSSRLANGESGYRFAGNGDEPISIGVPHRVEWTLRLHVPDGYVVSSTPENHSFRAGPVSFERTVSRDDETVIVRTAMDTGDGMLEPKEMDELVDHLVAIKDQITESGGTYVRLRLVAADLLERDESIAAITELRRLVEDDPTGGYHVLLAETLLGRGLGRAARRVINEAVEQHPDDWRLPERQGYVHLFDEFGRELSPGWARDVAEKSLRRSLELQPSVLGKWNLATALARDADGTLTSDSERLSEAIEVYRDLAETGEAVANGLAISEPLGTVLFAAGRDAELLRLPQVVGQTRGGLTLELASRIRRDGVPAALRWLNASFAQPRDRDLLLGGAFRVLLDHAEYTSARSLLPTIQPKFGPNPTPGIRSLLRLAKDGERYDPPENPFADPEGLVRELYARLIAGRRDEAAELLLQPDARNLGSLPGWLEGPLYNSVNAAGRRGWASLVEVEKEGTAESGFRVQGRLVEPWEESTWFAVPTENGFRLITNERAGALLGERALALLKDGKPEPAEVVLEWADELQPKPGLLGFFNPYRATPYANVRRLAAGVGITNPRRVAAAVLAAGAPEGAGPKSAVPILEAALAKAKPELAFELRRALVSAYATLGRDRDVLAITEALLEDTKRDPSWPFDRHVDALARQGKWDEVASLCEKWGKRVPARERIVRGWIAFANDKIDEANESWPTGDGLTPANAFEAGLLAATKGKPEAETIERFGELSGVPGVSMVVAALHVEQGKWASALPIVVPQAAGRAEHDAFYVLGRMCELAGCKAEAAHYYSRVPALESLEKPSFALLARRRQAALE